MRNGSDPGRSEFRASSAWSELSPPGLRPEPWGVGKDGAAPTQEDDLGLCVLCWEWHRGVCWREATLRRRERPEAA